MLSRWQRKKTELQELVKSTVVKMKYSDRADKLTRLTYFSKIDLVCKT